MTSRLLQRKPLERFFAEAEGRAGGHALKRALGPIDLVMLGIGGIIGTGIFVLTGVAAVDHAGPAVVASFAVAGLACALAGLCYAEFATLIPISGSAYSYAYATLGEIIAWVIGWDLILEYAVAASAVASGWSGYFRVILDTLGIDLPAAISHAPGTAEGALVNLPALLVILAVSTLLVIGIRESARANAVIVALKLAVILFVIVAGFSHVDPANWHPFAPYGWNGVMAGGAIVFFSYIGFDCVTTAAEESRNPERDMPIGILGSLAICTLLYLAVSAIVTGMVPLAQIDRTAPLASAFHDVGLGFAAGLISIGAIVGLTSVLLVLLLGQSRDLSRDVARWADAEALRAHPSALSHAAHLDHHRGPDRGRALGAHAAHGAGRAREHRDALRVRARLGRRAGAAPAPAGPAATVPLPVGARRSGARDRRLRLPDGEPARRDLAALRGLAGDRSRDLLQLRPPPQPDGPAGRKLAGAAGGLR